MGRSEEALASYDRAIRLDATYAKAHCRRAELLASLGRTDDALYFYNRATESDPRYAPALAGKGASWRVWTAPPSPPSATGRPTAWILAATRSSGAPAGRSGATCDRCAPMTPVAGAGRDTRRPSRAGKGAAGRRPEAAGRLCPSAAVARNPRAPSVNTASVI